MRKIRVYNFLFLFVMFCLLATPILFLQTIKLLSILSIVLLCLGLAFNVERSITFRVIKVTDQLKWVNDAGIVPIYVLLKALKWLFVCFAILFIIEDIASMSILSCLNMLIFIPLIIESSCVYIGRNFIYTQGTYIPIEKISSIKKNVVKKGIHINYTEFIIKVDKKAWIIKFNSNMHTGIDAFTQLLEDNVEDI